MTETEAKSAVGIVRDIALAHGLTLDGIREKTRVYRIAHPRQEAMLALHRRGMTLYQIAALLNIDDHSTIRHGIKQAEQREVSQ